MTTIEKPSESGNILEQVWGELVGFVNEALSTEKSTSSTKDTNSNKKAETLSEKLNQLSKDKLVTIAENLLAQKELARKAIDGIEGAVQEKKEKEITTICTTWKSETKKLSSSGVPKEVQKVEKEKVKVDPDKIPLEQLTVDERVKKLHGIIEALRGDVKSYTTAFETNTAPQIRTIKATVEDLKKRFDVVSKDIKKHTNAINNKIDKLQEKVLNGMFQELGISEVDTLRTIKFKNPEKLIEHQEKQKTLNSDRSTQLSVLDSTWKEVVSRTEDLVHRLNWYISCVDYYERKQTKPFEFWYTMGQFDKVLTSPFASTVEKKPEEKK